VERVERAERAERVQLQLRPPVQPLVETLVPVEMRVVKLEKDPSHVQVFFENNHNSSWYSSERYIPPSGRYAILELESVRRKLANVQRHTTCPSRCAVQLFCHARIITWNRKY
jgi:hypothetical protein